MFDSRQYEANLADLLDGICHVPAELNARVNGLQMDSRKVQEGDLFLALSGSHSSATKYVGDAIGMGASAVVTEGEGAVLDAVKEGHVVEIVVNDLKRWLGQIADRFFQSPSQSLSVIGITGTNGKTSVSSYIARFMAADGELTGIIGTLGYGIPQLETNSIKLTHCTTPNVVDVHRYLAKMRDEGASCVAMEVSSHGLDQGRVDSVKFEGAVCTNLTQDHLDYHATMQNYFLAKSQLFKSESLKFAVINNDDSYAAQFKSVIPHGVTLITYGIDSTADIKASEAVFLSGISARVTTPFGELKLKSPLLGRFNLSNLLAVAAVAVAKKRPLSSLNLVNQLKPVEGRMEMLHVVGSPTVVIDYAHTPDALKNVLEAAVPHCKGRLYLVFGCGGNRDTGKRPQMGAIAEAMADEVLVTDDNARFEDPDLITADILKGFSSLAQVKVIHDRKEAIASALMDASEKDLVLIAGKGHETWQETKGEKTYFSDREEVCRILGIEIEAAHLRQDTGKGDVSD